MLFNVSMTITWVKVWVSSPEMILSCPVLEQFLMHLDGFLDYHWGTCKMENKTKKAPNVSRSTLKDLSSYSSYATSASCVSFTLRIMVHKYKYMFSMQIADPTILPFSFFKRFKINWLNYKKNITNKFYMKKVWNL